MKEEIENLPAFFVAGLSVRTINSDGQAGKDIGKLWQELMQSGIADRLTDRQGNEVYCVYSAYESDHTGYYTALLGYKVGSIEYLPDGLTGIAVSAGKYAVFSSAGNFSESIGLVWQHIWQSDLDRLYTADFDVYTLHENFDDTSFKTFVAID
jgi:predicted transcriptional regulator YdeE